jgi:predicted RNA-binding Zn ribbon-like protein
MAPHPDFLLQFLETTQDTLDPLSSPGGLAAWLAARGLAGESADPASDGDVRLARRLRAALRAVVSGQGAADPRTAAAFADVLAAAPLSLSPGGEGLTLAPSADGGAAAGLARVAVLAYRAQLDGRLDRYKACQKCGWVFFDASKNRSRRWCDMALCGSQAKAQAYRDRLKSRQ